MKVCLTEKCHSTILYRYILVILTMFFCLSTAAQAQVGIGFQGSGTYTGTIGTNKGALEAYQCPPGTVMRGAYHVDKSMEYYVPSTRGMTSQVGLYCASLHLEENGNVKVLSVTQDGTPTILGYGYNNPGTVKEGYCPAGSIVEQLGGYDRKGSNVPWSTSLVLKCPPMARMSGDWIGLSAVGNIPDEDVGVLEDNFLPNVKRGPFCDANDPYTAVSGIHRQAGGEGYDGINVYCGQLRQARHSSILSFNNFSWDQSLGGSGWFVNLTQNGVLLSGSAGTGANKVPYGAGSDNDTSKYKAEHELFVLPGNNYGAVISRKPEGVTDRTFVTSGSCLSNNSLGNVQDKSCEIKLSGRPDIAVSIDTPDETYDHIGQAKNVVFTAANMGSGIVGASYGYALNVEIPDGWTVNSGLPAECTLTGQALTCKLEEDLAASSGPNQQGQVKTYAFPFTTTSNVQHGSFPVKVSLNRVVPDASNDLTHVDFNTANDTAQANIDYSTIAAITLFKQSLNGVGSFEFSGDNGWKTHIITTNTAGNYAKGTLQNPDSVNNPVNITEKLPENWRMTKVQCRNLDGGAEIFSIANPSNNSFTIDAEHLEKYDDIGCFIINEFVDIKTSKSSNVGDNISVKKGDIIEYTLTTVISGGNTIDDVVLTDTLSAGLEFIQVVQASSEFTQDISGPILKFVLPADTPPATYKVIYRARVLDDANTSVKNDVVASTGECRNCSITNPIVEIFTEKSSNVGNGQAVQIGDVITYTLTTQIKGGALADDLVLEDILGDGLEFTAVTDSGLYVADVISAQKIKFTLKAGTPAGEHKVSYQATVLQKATVQVSNKVVPDSGSCVNCETVNPIVGVLTNKSSVPASGTAVDHGKTITYNLSVVITDGNLTSPLTLKDTVSSGLEIVEPTDQGAFAYDRTGNEITFTLPTGTAPGKYDVTYDVKVLDAAIAAVDNIVKPSYGDCGVCETQHPIVGINTEKTSSIRDGEAVQKGDVLEYTLTVNVNNGPYLEDIVLTDTLSNGLKYLGMTSSSGNFTDDATAAPVLKFTLFAGSDGIANGPYKVTYEVKVEADAVGKVSNKVEVNHGSCSDCEVENPVLSVESSKKSNVPEKGAVSAGDIITYTIQTVIATGGAGQPDPKIVTSQKIVLTDTLGAGLTLIEDSVHGDFDANISGNPTLTFTLHEGTPAGTYQVTYQARVDEDAAIRVNNVVSTNIGSCETCKVTIPISSIETNKSSNIGIGTSVQASEIITYTLSVIVKDAPTTHEVVLTDKLGTGLTYVEGSVEAGNFTANTVSAPLLEFRLSSNAAVGTHQVRYQARVNEAAVTQVSNQVTSDSTACTDCEIVIPVSTVETKKTSNIAAGSAVKVDDVITYKLSVTVKDGVTKKKVVLTDTIGDGLTFIEGSVSGADFTANTSGAPDLVFTLPAGAGIGTHEVSYKAKVNEAATIEVGNRVASDTGLCNECVVIIPLLPDIRISKTLKDKSGTEQDIAHPGEELTYEIRLINEGGATDNYAVQDLLDVNTVFVEADHNGRHNGEAQGGTVLWENLTLPASNGAVHGELTLTVKVRVVDPLPADVKDIRNIAKKPGDPNPPCPSEQCVVLLAEKTKLVLTKTGEFAPENSENQKAGDIIQYSFTVVNQSNVTVQDITIDDAGPKFDDKAGTNKLSAITPTLVTLKPGEEQPFTATYVLSQADIDNASGVAEGVQNTALAKGYSNGTATTGKLVESNEFTDTLEISAVVDDITVVKMADLRFIRRGEQAPFTIKVINNSNVIARNLRVVDTMPSGFRYIDGTGSVGGVKQDPIINGRSVIFENIDVPAHGEVLIRLRLLALSTAGPGKHTNVVIVTDETGSPITPKASADVEILVEAVFDCGDIIGTVFDDKNRNGYQDEGEKGLPGVRVATAKGWLITTDQYGRFHVPCAALPDQRIGSNFIMKLDPRTLPTGYRLTTENPRVIRLTAGKMSKLNFGASISRIVRLDLQAAAFENNSVALKKQWENNLKQLVDILKQEISVLRVSYKAQTGDKSLAKDRIKQVRKHIQELWKKQGDDYRLEIETRVEVSK